ncbi:MAG TPA: L-histidine N(alpha)-methyltransferase, partial [Fimbriimonadaceae bacterium]
MQTDWKPELDKRLTVIAAPPKDLDAEFATAVEEGLSAPQKTLPSRFFYDFKGSELFEQITDLPEYYLTRTEASLFSTVTTDIIGAFEKPVALVEFGSGSSKKTRLLIEAALRRQDHLDYVAIDIATDFLVEASQKLLADYPGLSVTAIAAEYFEALHLLPEAKESRMFLFMGSNLGNFDDKEAVDFLRRIREQMKAKDALLIGVDLTKDSRVIYNAYNDSENVTRDFNKNLLTRINRELGANFDLSSFEHEAPYDPETGRVEMRLVSMKDQTV